VSPAPLLVFDFDGVLVDGMPEYWWSARRAAQRLDSSLVLPEQTPAAFAAHIEDRASSADIAAQIAASVAHTINPSIP
jgi:phosphoserine phosphatase